MVLVVINRALLGGTNSACILCKNDTIHYICLTIWINLPCACDNKRMSTLLYVDFKTLMSCFIGYLGQNAMVMETATWRYLFSPQYIT